MLETQSRCDIGFLGPYSSAICFERISFCDFLSASMYKKALGLFLQERIFLVRKKPKKENEMVEKVELLTLIILHSERPKLHTILAFLSAVGLIRN